ncbi:hypothetical protein FF38_05642, partial [Lucilia cuprina]
GNDSISTPKISPHGLPGADSEFLNQQFEAQVLHRLNNSTLLEQNPNEIECQGQGEGQGQGQNPGQTQCQGQGQNPHAENNDSLINPEAHFINPDDRDALNVYQSRLDPPGKVKTAVKATKKALDSKAEENKQFELNSESTVTEPLFKKVKREDGSSSPELQFNKFNLEELESANTEDTENEIEDMCQAVF